MNTVSCKLTSQSSIKAKGRKKVKENIKKYSSSQMTEKLNSNENQQ